MESKKRVPPKGETHADYCVNSKTATVPNHVRLIGAAGVNSGLAARAFVAVTAGTSSAVTTVTVASTASASVTAVEPGLALVLHPALRSGQKSPAGQSHLAGLLVYLKELDIHLVSDLKHILPVFSSISRSLTSTSSPT